MDRDDAIEGTDVAYSEDVVRDDDARPLLKLDELKFDVLKFDDKRESRDESREEL